MFPPTPHIRAGSSWWQVTDLSDLVVSPKSGPAVTPEFPAWVGSSLYTGISWCTHATGVQQVNMTHRTSKKWPQSGLIYCYVWPSHWLMNGLGTPIDHGRHQQKCTASYSDTNTCTLEKEGLQNKFHQAVEFTWGSDRIGLVAMGDATPLLPSANWPAPGLVPHLPRGSPFSQGQVTASRSIVQFTGS